MGDFSDFYNKQITLISESAGDMVGGRYKKGETTSKTIDCFCFFWMSLVRSSKTVNRHSAATITAV